MGDMRGQLSTLYLRKSLVERQIWDYESMVSQATNTLDRRKWSSRLMRLQKELERINQEIQILCKEIKAFTN